MFKGSHNKPGCLDRPPPHSGNNYPLPIVLSCCIHKTISFYHICGSPYTDPVQPAWHYVPGDMFEYCGAIGKTNVDEENR